MRIEATKPETGDTAQIAIEGLERPVTLMHITDSHMMEWDERDARVEEDGQQKRESFMDRTPGNVSMSRLFEERLEQGRQLGVDAFILTGDLIHFPAYAGLELIQRKLAETNTPFQYVAGNHDWLFPFESYEAATRSAYSSRFNELMGADPLCQVLDVAGVRIIGLDNSTQQLEDVQVEFLKAQLGSGLPCVVSMHIPLYLPTLDPAVREKWKAPLMMGVPDSEEIRSNWPGSLPTAATRAGAQTLLAESAGNLVGVFCGHVHFDHVDMVRPNCFQYVTQPCFEGGYRIVKLVPIG